MSSINIQTADGLVEIGGKVTEEKIISALGYTPADKEDLIDNITEDESGELSIADESGNVIMSIGTDGVHTTEVIANGIEVGKTVSEHIGDGSIHVTTAERTTWNNKSDFSGFYQDLQEAPNITEDNSGEVSYTDEAGNVIAKINSEGLETTQVIVGDAIINGASAKAHIEDGDIHITSSERTSWNNKATTEYVDTKVANLVNSAPEALDTLDELAAALGDDANFATTVTEAIGKKANQADLNSHTSNVSNPHNVTKAQIDLGNVDNTSDANKPVSAATQTALDELKTELSESIVSESEEWKVVDNNGNVVAVIDVNGLETTAITASSLVVNGQDIKAALDEKVTAADVNTKVDSHNTSTTAHEDIRELINNTQSQLNKKINIGAAYIELNSSDKLKGYGGYLDFHYYDKDGNPTNASGTVVDSTPDYTSRIIENSPGSLSVNGVSFKDGVVTGSLSGNATTATTASTATKASKDGDGYTISERYMSKTDLTGSGVVSFGRSANSTIGEDSIVIGNGSKATAKNSIAIGNSDEASGENSTAIGTGSTASGLKSIAFGDHNTASGEYAVAMGCWTKAPGTAATAIGNASTSNGWGALASGIVTTAKGLGQHVFGAYNIPDSNTIENYYDYSDNLIIVGNGDIINDDGNQSNAYTLDWNGNGWFAGDVYVGSTSGTNKDTGSKKLVTVDEATTLAANAAAGKANASHAHTISDVTNLQSSLNAKQATITGAASTITSSNLASDQVIVSNGSGKVVASDVTSTELGYLKGATSNIQEQLTNKINTSILPNNSGEIETKFRIAQKGYTSGATWYYKLCDLPTNDSGNYASAILSGRIGGWVSDNMSYVNALAWNRGTPGIALMDIAGDAKTSSSIWNIADLVLYTNGSSTTAANTASLYVKCSGYFTFDIDLEIFQSSATITYDGTYTTTTPSGTLAASASTSSKRLELVNGQLLVNGNTFLAVNGNAVSATKATQDGNGNVIVNTYETKTDATSKLNTAKAYTDTKVANLVTKNYVDGLIEGLTPEEGEASATQVLTLLNSHKNDTTVHITANERTSWNAKAETSYVDTKTAALETSIVDSAPSDLNTLKKLANAIGNDASYSTTVTNALEAKANKTDFESFSESVQKALDSLENGEDEIKSTTLVLRQDLEELDRENSETHERYERYFLNLEQDVASLAGEVTNKVDSEEVSSLIQAELASGVTKISTPSGNSFDDKGLNIGATKIESNGITISGTNETSITDSSITSTSIKVSSYFEIGNNSRFQDYLTNRTGCFWIGG